jgi:hypothetical protein
MASSISPDDFQSAHYRFFTSRSSRFFYHFFAVRESLRGALPSAMRRLSSGENKRENDNAFSLFSPSQCMPDGPSFRFLRLVNRR